MLTEVAVKRAKPTDKPYRLSDGGGMFLEVRPNGSKYWRMAYRFGGKQKLLALGVYPDVGLKDARDRRDEARKLLAAGVDPGESKKAAKIAKAGGDSFEAITREFMANKSSSWSASHHRHVRECFERDVFPWIGSTPIKELGPVEVLTMLRRITARGALETAARTRQFVGQAFRYAVATGRADRDPTGDLRGALPSPTKGHFSALTDPREVGEMLRALDRYSGTHVVRIALQLAPLVMVRPANLAQMEWSELDLDAGEWRIPAEKMKARAAHFVPLSKQAVALLREIYPLSGDGRYVFPSATNAEASMSRETLGASMRRLGLTDRQTAHGLRTTASTILHEQGFNSDVIERQLAHAERNKVKAAYCRAEFLPERRKMMQAWADYLDRLKHGAEVIPLAPKRKA